ncbi:MAG TPA: hydroxymethylbilane synthase [Caulobacteraceae bacterium]|nr:hydroxymethylbilane synthase [Caulobacteraceae bacterium]
MTSAQPLRIGARGSPLSLAQTGQFRDALALAHPERSFEIVPIVTSGDRIQDRLLIESGGKGLFTKELDEALLDGRIDLAVHSMKDLPTQLPDGIVLACVPLREDPRDALICDKADTLLDLPSGARIGTASLRRQAQLMSLGLGFEIVMLRGNVETRLRKVASGEMDATLLAYAGLRRLGLADHAKSLLDPALSPPAAGQGALAVTTRARDLDVLAVLSPLNDQATRLEITAERAFLAALDGSCRTPIAALGRWTDGRLAFIGEALTPDGEHRWRRTGEEPCADEAQAALIGLELGQSIRREAGDALYTEQSALVVNSV